MSNSQNIEFQSVVAGTGPIEIGDMYMFKEVRKSLMGDINYIFSLELGSMNVVSGTLTTPDNKVYALESEEDGEFGLWFAYASDTELIAKGFTNGTYTLTLNGPTGQTSVQQVDLAGQYPNELPVGDKVITTTVQTNPTLAWQGVTDANVNAVHFGFEGMEMEEEEEQLWMSDLSSRTSWTPVGDLTPGAYGWEVDFAIAQMGMLPSGGEFITGYLSGSEFNLNILAAAGDRNFDGQTDALDIDKVFANIGKGVSQWDINDDGTVDQADVDELVGNILGCRYGDTNLDYAVDFLDFQALLNNWISQGGAWSTGDFTGDRVVDFVDFQQLLNNWSPGGGNPVPEPATLALLSFGGLLLARKNKRTN